MWLAGWAECVGFVFIVLYLLYVRFCVDVSSASITVGGRGYSK